MFCQNPNCGTEVASSYKICPKCGGRNFGPQVIKPIPPVQGVSAGNNKIASGILPQNAGANIHKSHPKKLILIAVGVVVLLLGIFFGYNYTKEASKLKNAQMTYDQLSSVSQNPENIEELFRKYRALNNELLTISSSNYYWLKVKASSLRTVISDKLKTMQEEVDYRKLLTKHSANLASAKSYDELIKLSQDMLSDINAYKKDYPQARWPVDNLATEIQTSISSVYAEKIKYTQIEPLFTKKSYSFSDAESAIVEIDSFIKTYPTSIMKEVIAKERDNMEHIKMQVKLNADFTSLSQLNGAVSASRSYLKNIRSEFLKQDGEKRINEALAKKKDVLAKEINISTDAFLNSMKEAATDAAKGRHTVCGSSDDPTSVEAERRNNVGNRLEIYREYKITTHGDLFCGATYILGVSVDGSLTVDENTGVSYSVGTGRVEYNHKQ